MFIEYPKSLYRGLDDERVANDAAEERALRAEGYSMLTDTEEEPKRRGRPPKVTNGNN